MGMGDQKIPYRPPYKKVKCVVSGYEFPMGMISECPHPSVLKKYKGNTVSVYVCFKCKYVQKHPFCGAVSCGYKKENNDG